LTYTHDRHQPGRAESELLALTLRIAVLEDLSHLLGRQIPINDACQYITNLIPTIVDAEAAAILLFDAESATFTTAAKAGDRANAVNSLAPGMIAPDSIAHWVAKQEEPLAMAFPTNDHRFSPGIDGLEGRTLRSLACIPMLAQDKTVGVIQVFNRRESPLFLDSEIDLLSALANQAALVIENARLIETLAEKDRQLSSLVEVATKVASSLDLRTVLVEILNAAVSVLGGNAASILLVDKQSGQLFFEAALGDRGLLVERYNLPPGRGIAGWVVKERSPVYVRNAPEDPRFDATVGHLVGLEVHSVLAAPLNVRDESIGVIEVLNPPEGGETEKLTLISAFADHAALAVNNARLLEEARSQLAAPAQAEVADDLAKETEWSASLEQITMDGIILVDSNGHLLRANPAARELLQLRGDALPSLKSLIPDAAFAAALAAQPEGPHSVELGFGTPPNRRHLQARFYQFPNRRTLIAFSDFTSMRTLEQVGDDLRLFASKALLTPLSAIKQTADALLSGAKTPAETTSLLRLISQECDGLLQLVDSMGRLTEVEAGLKLSLQPVSLDDLIRKALASDLITRAQRNISSQVPPDLPPVAADPEKLLQVLLALLSNAIRYSPPESPVTVEAKRHSPRTLSLSVSDQGIGIPDSEMPLIFNKYYAGSTPSPSDKGIGLGLYLVKQLVDAHRGEIQVNSQPGKGSTFTIILPIHQEGSSAY